LYAQRNIESLTSVSKRVQDEEDYSSSTKGKESLLVYAMRKFPSMLLRVIMAFGFVYAFTWLMNNANGKMNEKYKFEVKTAKDI